LLAGNDHRNEFAIGWVLAAAFACEIKGPAHAALAISIAAAAALADLIGGTSAGSRSQSGGSDQSWKACLQK
jgi:hypothetical protein